ncbi:MAG: Wzz/FepE/Etk N-terminal domain-containing protein [Actinomycetota bacterium]
MSAGEPRKEGEMHEGERNRGIDERSELHGPTTSLSHYLAPIRNQSRVVTLVTVVVVALGITVALAGPRSYTATTSVVVQPVSANPSEAIEATERTADMATEARIASSRAVANATADGFRELAVEIAPDVVAERITVTNRPEDSRVLDIAYRASDPSVARVGSELATAAYLEYRSALNTATLEASRVAVDEQIAELQDQLVDVEERLDATAIGSPARLAVEVEQTSIQGELAAQQRALAGLSTLAVDTATVIDEARQPSSPDGLGAAQIVAGALAGGLVLGVIAAWILDAIGLPPLGATPAPAQTTTAPTADRSGAAETNGSEPGRKSRTRSRRRRRKAEKEPDDVDDPFDDTDDRDPLELLKALDVIEADPSIAFKASREKKERAKAEAGQADADPADDQRSFAEMYPVEYFDADGDAGNLIDKLEARSDDDDQEIGQVRTDEELLSSVDRLLRSPSGRLPDPVEPGAAAVPVVDGPAGFDPPAEHHDIGHDVDAVAPAGTELGVETADVPLGAADRAVPTDDGDDWASSPADSFHATFEDIGLGGDSLTEAMDDPDLGEAPELDDLSEFPAPTELTVDDVDTVPETDAFHDGDPFDGDPLDGDAFEEHAIDGQAFDEHNINGHGFDEHNIDEHAIDGHGFDEHNIDGHGFDEHNIDEHAVDNDPLAADGFDEHAVGEPTVGEVDAATDVAVPDVDEATEVDTAADDGGFADAGIPSGDPSDLDPGPPSWDEPFIGPVTWDELSAKPGADPPPAGSGHPFDDADLVPIDPRIDDRVAATPTDAGPAALAPPPGQLRATDDLRLLLDQLGRIGGDGPVTLLSLSDRDPTAGLTTGFEVADELRATGSRVLLIDTRIEEPVLDALFDGEPRSGLAQVVAGDEVLDQAIRTLEGLDGLSLLPVGAVGPDTGELLTGPAMARLLSQAQLDFGSIVIIGESLAGPEVDPTATRARTRALADVADGLIVGTTDPVGSGPDDEVVEALDDLAAPTLQLLAAHLPVADTATEPASV